MLRKVLVILVITIFLLILFFLSIAILRRIVNARKYKKLDKARSYYLKILQEAFEKKDILSVINDLISRPGSIKFQAIEDVLFKLQDRFPEDIKKLFVRLSYVKFYENMLHHKNKIKRAIAIDKLGRMGIETSVNKISEMLKSPDSETVSVSIRALANIGSPYALASILDFLPELFNKWLITRKSIETALLKFGEKGSSLLIQYGKNISDPKILAIVLDTLSHLNNSRAVELASASLYHSHPEVRTKALKVIEKFSYFLNEDEIERILTLSKDPVWFVRLHVARILGKINGSKDVSSYLERLILDENWHVRIEASRAIVSKKEKGFDLILKILRGNDRYAIESICEEIAKTDLYSILISNLKGHDEEISNKSREILKILNSLGFSTPLREYLDKGEKSIKEELRILLSERKT